VGDTDENVSALTRDGEMSLNLLPVIDTADGPQLLDGTPINSLDEWWRNEELNLNMLAVPKSWRNIWRESLLDTTHEGLIMLPMKRCNEDTTAKFGDTLVKYNKMYGLEKVEVNG
jgi:CRISPR-associated endonuclease/helicase Cas3